MNQLNDTKAFKEDNEFWKEVYYYMERNNCYKDEAVEVISKKHENEEFIHAM